MRFLILAILVYLVYRMIKGAFGLAQGIARGGNRAGTVIDEMVQDPFCMTYVPRRESVKRIIQGQTYFFCSDNCADKFESEWKG